jgi:hypothetical protein
MVKVDAIEGVIDSTLWCHYDLANDVLYLRQLAVREVTTYSEETDDGFLLVRREDNDEVAGLSVVNWWKRFGVSAVPDSIRELERAIEPWARKLAA